jgi:hypothetical protein
MKNFQANFAVGKRGIMDALSDLGQALGNHFYNQINQSVQSIKITILLIKPGILIFFK